MCIGMCTFVWECAYISYKCIGMVHVYGNVYMCMGMCISLAHIFHKRCWTLYTTTTAKCLGSEVLMNTEIWDVPNLIRKWTKKSRVYIEYTDFGSKTNRGGLKTMKVDNKIVRHYENLEDPQHCVVNLLVRYLECIPSTDGFFISGHFRMIALVFLSWKKHIVPFNIKNV